MEGRAVNRILSFYEKCSGCKMCELICAKVHEKVINPKKSRIRVLIMQDPFKVPNLCAQCENPPCARVCPVDAIVRLPEYVHVNLEKCIACGRCFNFCPIRAIYRNPESGKPLICDLCQGKIACVKWCPRGALKLFYIK